MPYVFQCRKRIYYATRCHSEDLKDIAAASNIDSRDFEMKIASYTGKQSVYIIALKTFQDNQVVK